MLNSRLNGMSKDERRCRHARNTESGCKTSDIARSHVFTANTRRFSCSIFNIFVQVWFEFESLC